MFKPQKDYYVKKDRDAAYRRLRYVIAGIVVFLLGFALQDPLCPCFCNVCPAV